MEQYNLILVLDKNITAVAATERNRSDIITICGEGSIPLRGESSIDEVTENIKEYYSILDFSDKCINTIIIKNEVSEKLAAYTFEKFAGSTDINIVNMITLAPMLVRNKGLDLPASISLNGISYCVDDNGVALTDNTDTATEITYDDLLFLFWVKPELLSNNSMELKKKDDEIKWYRRENTEQSKKIEQLEKSHTAETDELRKQLQDKCKLIDELKRKSETFEVANDSEFRNELKDYVSSEIAITDYYVTKKSSSSNTEICILNKKTNYFYKFVLDRKEARPDLVLRKTAKAIEMLIDAKEFNSMKVKVGDSIKFGTFRFNKVTEKKDIEWRVLSVDGEKVLLISKYILFTSEYDSSCCADYVTWSSCSLRELLNNYFYNNAFNEREKAQIINTYVTADRSPFYNTDPGGNTNDNVFLLSSVEAQGYFNGNGDRISKFENKDSECEWWLRTPGRYRDYVSYVGGAGYISETNHMFYRHSCGVRPAIWISL